MKFIHLIAVSSQFLFSVTTASVLGSFAVSRQSGLGRRDAAPVPGADGVCFTYTVQEGDTCDKVAESHSVSTSDIETWNTGSWGWRGCTKIMQGDFVCLSSGALPMPVALPNAVCGPQMPGSIRPQNYADLASLNPCFSGQCCSRWYQCGTSDDFCSVDKGCLSNCGAKAALQFMNLLASLKKTSSVRETTAPTSTTTSESITSQEIVTTSMSTSTSTTLEVTTITSVTAVQPIATWSVTLYEDKGCKDGNYFALQGHEKRDYGTCVNLKENTATTISDDSLSCRWWTNEGLDWSTCASSKMTSAKSWYLPKDSACWVYTDDKCEEYGGRMDRKGCWSPNLGPESPGQIGSIKCWSNEVFL